jgi:hypothetical protein
MIQVELPINISQKSPSMMRTKPWTPKSCRGSVSVELALIVSLFLFPLIACTLDSLFVLVLRYQANQAIQSIYFFTWANPGQSTNSSSISNVLKLASSSDLAPFYLVSAPSTTTTCLQTDGSSTASSNGACSSGTPQTNVTYNIVATAQLPIPLLVFPAKYDYNLVGTVTVQ